MICKIVLGGSGKWQYEEGGLRLAAGHCPRQVPAREVIVRQISRIARTGEDFNWPNLGGGQLYDLEVEGRLVAALKAQAVRRKDKAQEDTTL